MKYYLTIFFLFLPLFAFSFGSTVNAADFEITKLQTVDGFKKPKSAFTEKENKFVRVYYKFYNKEKGRATVQISGTGPGRSKIKSLEKSVPILEKESNITFGIQISNQEIGDYNIEAKLIHNDQTLTQNVSFAIVTPEVKTTGSADVDGSKKTKTTKKRKENIMTKKVTIIGADRDEQTPKGVTSRLIEAAVAKDEDTFKSCLTQNSLEMISVDEMALEGNTVTFGDVTAEGELFIVPTSADDGNSSEDFTFVVREENGELRIDMQATMERMMGMSQEEAREQILEKLADDLGTDSEENGNP